MNCFTALTRLTLLGTTALLATTMSAEARDRWRYHGHTPWHDGDVIMFDDGEETAWYDDEGDIVIVRPRKQQQRQVWQDENEPEIWWLDDGAHRKLEERGKARKAVTQKPPVKKPVVAKPATVPTPKLKPNLVSSAAAATPVKPVIVAKAEAEAPDMVVKKSDPVVTASLAKPKMDEAPKNKPVTPKLVTTKPVVAKPAVGKTIGCTAGAAVIVGYGFADVKPKTCTGESYAYTATRAAKNYEIKLTAKSGEITDVKKVN